MFDGLLHPTHLSLILVSALIIFGPGKLPELGKTLGTGIREFREAASHAGEPEPPAPAAETPAFPPEQPRS
jgi:sec-independent protein translocase protein TatA